MLWTVYLLVLGAVHGEGTYLQVATESKFDIKQFLTENNGRWDVRYGPGTSKYESLSSSKMKITHLGNQEYREVTTYTAKHGEVGVIDKAIIKRVVGGETTATLKGQTLTPPPYVFHKPLDPEELHTLYWTPDYDTQTVSLEAHFHVPADNWVALGFSDYGEITNADLCVLWFDQDGVRHVQDSWTDKDGFLHKDQSQDCDGARFERTGNSINFHFTRKFDTSDQHDYVIEEGTTHMVWATGSGSLVNHNIASAQHGFQWTDLLRNKRKVPMSPDTFATEITYENFKLPPEENVFWRKVIKLPDVFKRKHHIVKFEPIIPAHQKSYFNHLKVYHCAAKVDVEIPAFEGIPSHQPDFLNKICRKTVAVWTTGGSSLVFPEEAGLPIGGPDYNLYMLLDSHYGNNELRDDVLIQRSGMRLYVTPTLRAYDAGIMELGLKADIVVPLGQPHFSLNGHCSARCTKKSLPAEGITIFGTMLHTHAHGIRMVMRHIRDGKMLPDIFRDNHYSKYLEELRLLKKFVHVNPGDSLVASCVYNTTGERHVHEACKMFGFYYPRTLLDVCISRQSKDQLFSAYKVGDLTAFSQPEYDSAEAVDEAFNPGLPHDDVCLNFPEIF